MENQWAITGSKLRDYLTKINFCLDAVVERIGTEGQLGLTRNTTIPAQINLGKSTDPVGVMSKLFVLQLPITTHESARLPVELLLEMGLVQQLGDQLVAEVNLRPYSSPDDGADGWLVSDLIPMLDGKITPTRPDYVLGVSPASTTLSQLTIRRPVDAALDLGTGCGVQSLHLSRHAKHVVATDLNPRAISFARLSMLLSGVEVDFRLGDLFGPVAGESFDLIVTNPPYVISPPTDKNSRLTYRESRFSGDGLVETIVRQAPEYLRPGGTLQVLGNWAIIAGQDWKERVAGWIGPDCAGAIMEREVLSSYEYVEMWLADAGLNNSPDWEKKYREWIQYFKLLGIEKVGMGWIEVQKTGNKQQTGTKQQVCVEEWPWVVSQPVGEAFAVQQEGRRANQLTDQQILTSCWIISKNVVEETTGEPGVLDPQHIVFRQRDGFNRAVRVSSELAGILGACDGELSLQAIISAVAQLVNQDEAELLTAVLPGIREVIGYGMLKQKKDFS